MRRKTAKCVASMLAGALLASTAGCASGDSNSDQPAELKIAVKSWLEWDTESPPCAGAAIALDLPSGERIESTADAEGRITLDGFDWADGTVWVTAYQEGHSLTSVALAEQPDGEYTIQLDRLDRPDDWIAVSGVALNMIDESNSLWVQSMTRGADSSGRSGTEWEMNLPPGEDFTVIAMEVELHDRPSEFGWEQRFVQWTRLDHGPVTGPTTVDIDFSTPLVSKTVDGSFEMPTDTDSPLRTGRTSPSALVAVSSASLSTVSSGVTGFTRLIDLADDQRTFEYTVEWVEDDLVPDPVTVVGVYFDHGSSYVYQSGYPVGGALSAELLDLPDTTPPAGSTERHGLHKPITWQPMPADVVPNLQVKTGVTKIWSVWGLAGSAELTVPKPPSAAPQDLLDPDGLSGSFRAAKGTRNGSHLDALVVLRPFKLNL